MSNLLFIIGSPRSKGVGHQFAGHLKKILYEKVVGIEINELHMADLNYENCLGCMQCFINGRCSLSLKDNYDFDKKLEDCQGIVIFIPTYIHQMPGKLKNCFDRMAYKIHQFPLIGKKAVIVTYTATNGAEELDKYSKRLFAMYGAEVVNSLTVYQMNEHFDLALNRIYDSIIVMLIRIKNNNYQVSKMQEDSFLSLKTIVKNELDQKIVTYKQKRWRELIKYSSLSDYIKMCYIADNQKGCYKQR